MTSIADRLNWELNWDKPSGYVSANEYIRPWDREGWGSNDVVITPPRNPGGYVPPSRPGIQEGQRDYVFMPTEKEQWRIGDENKRRQAVAVGKDWRESQLPRSVPKEKVYGDWREAEIPEREVTIQPAPRERDWGESRSPRERRRPSLRDTLMRDMGRKRGLVALTMGANFR